MSIGLCCFAESLLPSHVTVCQIVLYFNPLCTIDISILLWAIGSVIKQPVIRIWANMRIAVIWDTKWCGLEASRRYRKHWPPRFKNVRRDWSFECTPTTVNVFWKRCNAAWPFRSKPSSDRALPTAAMCSVLGSASVWLIAYHRRHLASW
jgi:hypothetical protein